MVLANPEVIGKTGRISFDGLHFRITVKDVKSAYGVLRYLIAPLDGAGERWVSADRVTIESSSR